MEDTPERPDRPEWLEQRDARVRLEWGPNGLRTLAPISDVLIVIDVLSFTTAVDVVIDRGGLVHPYRWHDGTEADFATEVGAHLATRDIHDGSFSLSPHSLVDFPSGEAIVLPSPNGSALSHGAIDAGATHVLAGCLRNASAVGRAADRLAGPEGVIGVVPAGERWKGATGPLRVAFEDLMGAGAIVAADLRDSLDGGASRGRGLRGRPSGHPGAHRRLLLGARADGERDAGEQRPRLRPRRLDSGAHARRRRVPRWITLRRHAYTRLTR